MLRISTREEFKELKDGKHYPKFKKELVNLLIEYEGERFELIVDKITDYLAGEKN